MQTTRTSGPYVRDGLTVRKSGRQKMTPVRTARTYGTCHPYHTFQSRSTAIPTVCRYQAIMNTFIRKIAEGQTEIIE